jgi:hypothetical protein
VVAPHEDAEEPQSEEQEAEREHQRAHDGPPRVQVRAVGPDDTDAEHRHAEGPAARRPRVCEVEELPPDENDGHDDIRPVPADRMAGHDVHARRNDSEAEREHALTTGSATRSVSCWVSASAGSVIRLPTDRSRSRGFTVASVLPQPDLRDHPPWIGRDQIGSRPRNESSAQGEDKSLPRIRWRLNAAAG